MFFDTSRLRALEDRLGRIEDEQARLRSLWKDLEDAVVHRVDKLLKRATRVAPGSAAAGGNGGDDAASPPAAAPVVPPSSKALSRRELIERQIAARRSGVSASAVDGG